MDIKTAAGQLDTLSRLLEADGWGDHYIRACIVAVDKLNEIQDHADALAKDRAEQEMLRRARQTQHEAHERANLDALRAKLTKH